MKFLLSISKLLDLDTVSTQVNEILSEWIGPIFTLIGAFGAVYAIILGVQYAKAENDSKRAELKSRMVNCIIGFLVLLVLGTVCLTVNWAEIVQIFGYTANDFDSSTISRIGL